MAIKPIRSGNTFVDASAATYLLADVKKISFRDELRKFAKTVRALQRVPPPIGIGRPRRPEADVETIMREMRRLTPKHSATAAAGYTWKRLPKNLKAKYTADAVRQIYNERR